ncbi:hypothetical protein ACFQ60_41290 [Streptomyces zhihengii]
MTTASGTGRKATPDEYAEGLAPDGRVMEIRRSTTARAGCSVTSRPGSTGCSPPTRRSPPSWTAWSTSTRSG